MKNIVINHFSTTLIRVKDIRVMMPDNFDCVNGKVVLLLHGYCGDYNDWQNAGGAQSLAEKYNVTLVMPSGENSYYVNIPGGDRFYDYVLNEVPDIVSKTLKISSNWYIAGLSMGGYGALLLGLSSNKFKAIGTFSAPVDMKSRLCLGLHDNFKVLFSNGITDDINILKLIDKENIPFIYQYCGEADQFFEMNKEFHEALEERKVDTIFESDKRGHEWSAWRDSLDRYLSLINKDN